MGLNLFLEGNWCIEFWAITIQVIHVALASSCYEVLRSHVKSDKCHSVASACWHWQHDPCMQMLDPTKSPLFWDVWSWGLQTQVLYSIFDPSQNQRYVHAGLEIWHTLHGGCPRLSAESSGSGMRRGSQHLWLQVCPGWSEQPEEGVGSLHFQFAPKGQSIAPQWRGLWCWLAKADVWLRWEVPWWQIISLIKNMFKNYDWQIWKTYRFLEILKGLEGWSLRLWRMIFNVWSWSHWLVYYILQVLMLLCCRNSQTVCCEPHPRFDSGSTQIQQVPAAPAPVSKQVQELDWPTEPKTIEDLLATHNVELKASGRWPGTTLFLVESKARNGKTENVVDGQNYKLFLASWLEGHYSWSCLMVLPANLLGLFKHV